MEQLSGKVVVVTGGASGIGLAMARRFAAEGARLVLADVEPDALGAAADELRGGGTDVLAVECDVSSAEAMDDLAARTFADMGTAHVVCNNAGVGSGGLLHTLTTADWQWVLGVNLWGVIHGLRVFLPRLLEQGEGHVVNTASVAGLFAPPFMGPYNASKFAVVAISETLFNELKMSQSPVGVSVLCPAWVATRIHESDRNRPDHLRNAAGDDDPMAKVTRDTMAGVIESGKDPAEIAEHVLEAVRTRKFYLLTHDDSTEAVRARMEAIVGGGEPPWFLPQ